MSKKLTRVIVTGESITDDRIFTSTRKLNSFVKMLNKHYKGLKIDIKNYKPN